MTRLAAAGRGSARRARAVLPAPAGGLQVATASRRRPIAESSSAAPPRRAQGVPTGNARRRSTSTQVVAVAGSLTAAFLTRAHPRLPTVTITNSSKFMIALRRSSSPRVRRGRRRCRSTASSFERIARMGGEDTAAAPRRSRARIRLGRRAPAVSAERGDRVSARPPGDPRDHPLRPAPARPRRTADRSAAPATAAACWSAGG